MSARTDKYEELEQLLSSIEDGLAGANAMNRLGELLDGDPDACEFYLDYMSLNAQLHREFGASIPMEIAEDLPEKSLASTTAMILQEKAGLRPPTRIRQPSVAWLPVAATLMIFAGLAGLLFMVLRPVDSAGPIAMPEAEAYRDGSIATLDDTIDAVFSPAGMTPEVGETLSPGMLRLEAGVAQVQFYNGATVLLEAPVEFHLLSADESECRYGKIRAIVPPAAAGFVVNSPQVELVDLGTEFGMSIERGGGTEVHVFDGQVELYDTNSNRSPDTKRLLTVGEALRINRSGRDMSFMADAMAFISDAEIIRSSISKAQARYAAWRQLSVEISQWPETLLHYSFENQNPGARSVHNQANEPLDRTNGAVVSCRWVNGRWPDKPALEFKRPSDRVRTRVDKTLDSASWVAWLRVDGLPHQYSALMLADEFQTGAPHWQLTRDGRVMLRVKNGPKSWADYASKPVFMPGRFGKWVQLTTVYDKDARRVVHYFNGKQLSAHQLRRHIPLRIDRAQIGNWSRKGQKTQLRNFNGRIDEFLLFEKALSVDEVKGLYDTGKPRA